MNGEGLLMHWKGFHMIDRGFFEIRGWFMCIGKGSKCIESSLIAWKEGFYALEGIQTHKRGVI